MHSCTANIGGFWNRLSETLSTAEGQPLRAFRIHGQPPLSRVAQEAPTSPAAPTAADRSRDDVRDLVGDDVFTVWAEPEADGDMRTAANLEATGIETIVVRPRGDNEGRQTVHPLSVETMDGTTTANLFGASIELFGAVAMFNSDDIPRIVENADLENPGHHTDRRVQVQPRRHPPGARLQPRRVPLENGDWGAGTDRRPRHPPRSPENVRPAPAPRPPAGQAHPAGRAASRRRRSGTDAVLRRIEGLIAARAAPELASWGAFPGNRHLHS